MRFLLLQFVFGLALALPSLRRQQDQQQHQQNLNSIQDASFHPGKEYVYHYDTQVLTGYPQASKIHAGFRISSLARVQFNTISKVRVQLENIVLYRVNEPVVLSKASESLMPEEFLKELVGDEAVTMEQFLQIPFGFEYEDGMVLRILLDDRETTWSANIKRGFTSLFEMNLEKRLLLEESFPAVQAQLPPHVNWYNVFERSPIGDCVTLYTITPTPENDYRYVTKVRDYNRCLQKPLYINSIMDGEITDDAQEHNPLINGATLKYSVKGDQSNFLILSAVGEGHIVLTPYKNQEYIKTTLNQTLYLKESKFIGREVSEISEIQHGKHKRDSIILTLPSSPVDCRDPFNPCNEEPKQVTESADVYTADKIYLHLNMAATNTEQITSEESTVHLRIVKDMLKTTPEPILKQLWDRLQRSKIEPQASIDRLSAKIYWEALTSTGTEDAASVVLDICSQNVWMANNCTTALRPIVLKTAPTERIINKLIQLTSAHHLRKMDKQVIYLTLGSFGYKLTKEMQRQLEQCDQARNIVESLLKSSSKHGNHYVRENKRNLESRCSKIVSVYGQIEEKILKELFTLSQSSRQEDKILALKALGNSGLPGSLPILKRFVNNPAELQIVRVSAVCAHRRIQYPQNARQQAIKTLLKLYLTTSESDETRSMAFIILTSLKPELPVLETVAMSLRHEKDAQVSSFVYSFLKAHSNSTYRPDKNLQINATAALQIAPEVHAGLEHSFYKKFSSFSDDYKRGDALSVAMIGDVYKYLGVSVRWDTYNYGLHTPAMEVGLNTEGLSPFLNKLFGPKGLFTSNKSLFDVLRRMPRDISPQQQINQIFQALRIQPRSALPLYGQLYFKMMGHEMYYLDFTKILKTITILGNVPTDMNEDELSIGVPIKIKNMFDAQDEQITLPSEAGFPVSVKVKALAAVNVEGSLSFKVAPYMLESDRQGQPPVALHGSLDLKPKVTFDIESSMGLDMFYVKPVVGSRGLIKFNAPLKKEFKVDLAYKRMNLKWFNQIIEKPVVEILTEPFSEFLLITEKNQSPVQVSDRRNIYDPAGTRVVPLSHHFKLNALGYELRVTGQVPLCSSVTPTCTYNPCAGRTLINIFWEPLQNAPSHFSLNIQEVRSKERDVSDVQKRDRNGRILPQSVDDILPYNDPIDIKERPVNLQQICNKFQQAFGKPMPFYNKDSVVGIVAQLDASSKNVRRVMQLEALLDSFKDQRVGQAYTRFWRSEIPDYDTQEWQMLSELGITYPVEVKEPKDTFDPEWQRELMKDLEYLISLESHKVSNQGINMTILSGLEQFNYPSKIRVPAFKILAGLVPEQLYNLMNVSRTTEYNRYWDQYWRSLSPIFRHVSQEVRVNVDAYFVKRDLPLIDYLTQVIKGQQSFIQDINEIISETFVAHAELPIIQWIDYSQAKTVHMIREIYNKVLVKDLLHNANQVHELLTQAESNLDTIVAKMTQLMEKVSTVSQDLDQNQKPILINNPEALTRKSYSGVLGESLTRLQETVQYKYSSKEVLDQDAQKEMFERFDYLRISLYRLSITQTQFIEKVQLAISNQREFDVRYLQALYAEIRDNLNIVDEVLKKTTIIDPVIKQSLLMVSVQHEFCIEQLEQYKSLFEERLNAKTSSHKTEEFISLLYVLKEQGVYIGERVALLYRHSLTRKVVVPHLNTKEYRIFRQITESKRQMIPELREFERLVAYNLTNLKNSDVVFPHIDNFLQKLTSHATELDQVEKALDQLGQTPKLYLMSEIMDALHYLKYSTEFGSKTLYSINDKLRFSFQQRLSELATKIQGLISNLSPIFTKYNKYNDEDDVKIVKILNTTPINTNLLDVQDILVQQTMLKEQINRFIRTPGVSDQVFSRILDTAVDHLNVLHQTLKQNEIQVKTALQQKKQLERQAVAAVWSKALSQQSSLYDDILSIYNLNRQRVQNFVRSSERITSLQTEITKMETDQQETVEVENKSSSESEEDRYRDIYRTQSLRDQINRRTQKKLQTLNQPQYHPTGVVSLLNFTWGNEENLNKSAKIQTMASRSVEQILTLFKQMSAVLRDEQIVHSVNRRLSEEPWLADRVMKQLNTFNHLHFIIQAQQEQLPQWMHNFGHYIKDLLKATLWKRYERQPAARFISEDDIHAMLDISTLNNEWDLYLLDQTETNVYQGIKKYNQLLSLLAFQNFQPVTEKVLSYVSNNLKPTKCLINKDKVYTFDNVNYQLPTNLTQKESLLAADCSEEKTFAITMRKSDASVNGQTVKIINYDRVVEITPGYLDIEVRVDGKIILLDNNKPVVFSKKLTYDLYQPSLKIVRKGWIVEVEFPLTGLYFKMEGTYFHIQVSQLFKRSLCGLCSNFDGQMSWEFEGPGKEIYTSSKMFSLSYVLNENSQEVRENNRRHPKGGAGKFSDDKDDERSWSKSDDKPILTHRKPHYIAATCKPFLRTPVVVKPKVKKTCFSMTPEKMCPMNCHCTVGVDVKVMLRCLSTNDPRVPGLVKIAEHGVIPDFGIIKGLDIPGIVQRAILCYKNTSDSQQYLKKSQGNRKDEQPERNIQDSEESSEHSSEEDQPHLLGRSHTIPARCKTFPTTHVTVKEKLKKTCFSEKPVESCPSSCHSTLTLPHLVVWSCLPTNDPRVPGLVEKAQNGIIKNITDYGGIPLPGATKKAIICYANTSKSQDAITQLRGVPKIQDQQIKNAQSNTPQTSPVGCALRPTTAYEAGSDGTACFSVGAVAKCPSACNKFTQTRRERFVCLPRSDSRVREFMQEIAQGHYIPDLEQVQGKRALIWTKEDVKCSTPHPAPIGCVPFPSTTYKPGPDQKACFSVSSVPKCPSGCNKEGQTRRETYVCLPRSDSRVPEFMRETAQGHYIPGMDQIQGERTMMWTERAVKCSPAPALIRCPPIVKTVHEVAPYRKVCFSLQPVPRCSQSCNKTQIYKRESVRFVCLKKSDKRVPEFLRQSDEGKVIPGINDIQGPRMNFQTRVAVACYKPENTRQEKKRPAVSSDQNSSQDQTSMESRQQQRRKTGECEAFEKTDVLMLMGSPNTCFSMQPLFSCPRGCRMVQGFNKEIKYNCLNSRNPEIPRLLREAEHGVISNISDYEGDKIMRIAERALVCIPENGRSPKNDQEVKDNSSENVEDSQDQTSVEISRLTNVPEFCKRVLKTLVLEEPRFGLTCFTMRPIWSCTCLPAIEEVTVKVNYNCLPSSDPQTIRLKRRAETQVLWNIRRFNGRRFMGTAQKAMLCLRT